MKTRRDITVAALAAAGSCEWSLMVHLWFRCGIRRHLFYRCGLRRQRTTAVGQWRCVRACRALLLVLTVRKRRRKRALLEYRMNQ